MEWSENGMAGGVVGGRFSILGLLVGNWECISLWLAEGPSEKNKSKKMGGMDVAGVNKRMGEIDFSLYVVALMTVICTHMVGCTLIVVLTNVLLTVLVKGGWGENAHLIMAPGVTKAEQLGWHSAFGVVLWIGLEVSL